MNLPKSPLIFGARHRLQTWDVEAGGVFPRSSSGNLEISLCSLSERGWYRARFALPAPSWVRAWKGDGVKRLWAMDLNKVGVPIRAHLIVTPSTTPERGKWPEELVTACGLALTQWNHAEGWWSVPDGKVPLDMPAVHCGVDLVSASENEHERPEAEGAKAPGAEAPSEARGPKGVSVTYRASELGACTKMLICKRLGFESTPDPNAPPIPAFERGKKMEGEIIAWMREQGWKIEQEQAEYLIPLYGNIVLECHPDVIAHLPGWQSYQSLNFPALPLAVEIKTCDLRAFEDFKENGILAKGLFTRYRWQVSAYALATGLSVAMVVREHETGENRTWVELLPSPELYSRDQIITRIEEIEEAAANYAIPVECDLPNIYCPIPFMHESVVVEDKELDKYAAGYLDSTRGLKKKYRQQIIDHIEAQERSRKVDTGRYSVSVTHTSNRLVMVRVTDRLDKKKRDEKGRRG